MLLNADLFARVKTVYDQKEILSLTPEQSMLLEKQYRGFSRNGAHLDDPKKIALREIDAELSTLSIEFGERVLADTNAYELHITREEDLSGLPVRVREAARLTAKQRKKEGWVFTLDYPSYIPFMTYADSRALRKEFSIAAGKKGFQKNENNTEQIVLNIVTLRHQRATLLGYRSHAHFVLEERMATSPQKVLSFLEDLQQKSKSIAVREFTHLENFAKDLDGIDHLQKWDSAYYTEKLKRKLFNLDQELLKPYFQLEPGISGIFTIAAQLFDLCFDEVFDIEKYHEDVKTYHVKNTANEVIAVFYADFHPREGKRNGAWMTSYKPQQIKNNVNERPHISIVCNFTKPTESSPSLLTFNEVTTLFHEFGHSNVICRKDQGNC